MALKVRRRLSHTFAALKYPNYRLYFIGQLVSLVGTWMQTTAQGYLIYQLTQSPAYLGYVTFANGIPFWLFTLYGGVIADRMPRRTLLVITQTVMMILAFILAALVFTNLILPWHVIVLTFFLGVANAFDSPTRLAFAIDMVNDREDLMNAIALNSMLFNSAAIVGPAVAGLVYAWVGPGWCFTLNGISFIAVIIALSLMRLAPFVSQTSRSSTLEQLKEGLHYVAAHDTIRMIIINVGVVSMTAMGMVTLLPAWAVNILGGNATTNGLLYSARGAGAVLGALIIAALTRYKIKGKLWTLGSYVIPLGMFAFSATNILSLSVITLFILGWSFMLMVNTSNALVQSLVNDELRGRVMSIYTLIFFGLNPIGALLLGLLADRFNEPTSVMLGAGVLMAFVLYVWFYRPELRKLQ
jgi:predicted MFS family arabinose efflux permease